MGKSECDICKGTGWLHSGATSVDDPLFGKAVPCRCKQEELAAQMAKLSNIGASQLAWTLENFPGDPAAKSAAEEALHAQKGMWTFISPFGRGKSGLLIACVNLLNHNGVPALYRTVPLMLEELRNGYRVGNYWDILDNLITVRVLALDELHRAYDNNRNMGLGEEEGSLSWAAEKLFTVLDERYSHWDERMTLIATNKNFDKTDGALASRLWDSLRSRVIHVGGEDLRPHAAEFESQLAGIAEE